jgi:hypothetical protein
MLNAFQMRIPALWMLLACSVELTAQLPFVCKNQFFLTLSYQTGTQASSLSEVVIDPNTGAAVLQTIDPVLNINPVNAAGYRFSDNFIYCLNPNTADLVRIDANGAASSIAFLAELNPNLAYYAGDISPDGRYLVLIGTDNSFGTVGVVKEVVRVDLESPTYAVSKVLTNIAGEIYDIAFHPITNKLYGYDSFTQRLVDIDPVSGTISFSYPTSGVPVLTGSLFFDAYGKLYAYGSPTANVEQNSLYLIDPQTGVSRFLTKGPPVSSSDGCSCPYTVELNKRVEPKITFPCTEVEYTFQFVNTSREAQSGLRFRDVLPPGFTYVALISNPIGGDVLTLPGDPVFAMENVLLPIGTSEIKIRVRVGDVPPGVYKNQARLGNLPATLGGVVRSDDLETLAPDDSTALRISGFPFDTIRLQRTVCSGSGPLRLDASVYTVNLPGLVTFSWQDGSTLPYLDITQPDTYTVNLVQGCETATVIFEVDASDFSVSVVQDTFQVMLGDSLFLEARVVNTGKETFLDWLDPEPGSIRCLVCPATYARPFDDVTYAVVVANELGCRDTASVSVRVLKNRAVYFPNVFTPDNYGDYLNQYFYPCGDVFTRVERLTIYSRWGDRVFETGEMGLNEPFLGWDGVFAGKKAPPGVYAWVARVRFLDGFVRVFRGDVTLIR